MSIGVAFPSAPEGISKTVGRITEEVELRIVEDWLAVDPRIENGMEPKMVL
jgi:hypothetical protein